MNNILDDFKSIGFWIAGETTKRKYDKKEIENLSVHLIRVKEYLELQELEVENE